MLFVLYDKTYIFHGIQYEKIFSLFSQFLRDKSKLFERKNSSKHKRNFKEHRLDSNTEYINQGNH